MEEYSLWNFTTSITLAHRFTVIIRSWLESIYSNGNEKKVQQTDMCLIVAIDILTISITSGKLLDCTLYVAIK